MSSNLGLATGELQQMQVAGGGESLWKEAFKRLRRDYIAMTGGITIILLILLALLAPLLSPHDPNKQYPNGTSAYGMPLPIGASGKVLTVELAEAPAKDSVIPRNIRFLSGDERYEFMSRDDIKVPAGQKQVTALVNPLSPEMSLAANNIAVTPEGDGLMLPIQSATLSNGDRFPLGTDSSGRDVLSRLIFGSRVSLQVGVVAIFLSVVIGCILGLVSGYFGGWVDMAIMRLTDIMMAFPDLLLVMAIVAVRGPSLSVIFIAISVVSWTQFARIVRSQVLTLREMEFIEASKALGTSDTSIMFKHILPNVAAPVIVVATMGIAGAIMTEAALSFLGFGVKAPTASWGSMINDGLGYFRDQPLIPLIPGLAIAITVFAFNLFGDGLRDALDPRLK